MKHRITLIPGDGIGPEVTGAVVKILESSGLDVEWESYPAGVLAMDSYGTPLPEALLESIRRNKVALKGPVTTPVGGGFTSVNVGLRKTLDLFANLRPVWNIPSVPSRYQGVDLVIVRENTEDLYSGLEHEVVPGVVESLKIITEDASTRIARFAFEHARKHGRKRITAVHKANIMKMSDGLFLKCVKKVCADYPDITCDERDRGCGLHAPGDEPDAVRRAAAARTCMATSCPTCAPGWSAGWASCRRRTWGPTSACSRRCTAARRTSRARASRTRRPCCCQRC